VSDRLSGALPPNGHEIPENEWEAAALVGYKEALADMIADFDERTTLLSDKEQ
jgi:hypothetical protein